jgi:hypothetical protein
MRNKFFLLCILLISLVAFSNFKQNVFAQAVTPSSDLKNDIILECVTFIPTDGIHRLPNEEAEPGIFTGICSSLTKCDIFICLPDNSCTTFDPAKDINYFGQDNTGMGLPGVRLASGNNYFSPGVINEAGQLLNVKGHQGYFLYAARQPEPLGAGVGEENATQQLGQAKLVFPAGAENCERISWDPYGRIFDAVSLEPLGAGEAIVTLLDENGNRSLNTLFNDVLIDEMGKYNIYINKDGKYKLKVIPKTEHLFTAVEPDARYKDLYEFIYRAGDPAFVEKAASPKRVDIPLKPKGVPYARNPDYIYKEYKDVWFEGESFTKIALRTVHPKTIVKVMVNGIELTEDGAGRLLPKTSDKEGYWLALIKKEVLSQEGFNIELIKNPQYYPLAKNNNYFGQIINKLTSLFIKNVSAQQSIRIDSGSSSADNKKTIIKFEPILDYIEGYAYDSEKKIIPKSKVNIKLKMNNKIYYSTTADDSGFFTMYPKNLPPYEFYLEIINPETEKILVQTTSEFADKNQPYLDSEKIDLMQATKQDQKIIDPITGKLNNIVKNNNPLQQNNQPVTSTKKAFNPAILIIIFIISLLVIVTLGLVFYIKKSKNV